MKKSLTLLAAMLCLAGYSQSVTNALPNEPWILNPLKDVFTSSNLLVAVDGMYSSGEKAYGFGLATVYNITPYVATALRIDGIVKGHDVNIWMPQVNAQLDLPTPLPRINAILIPFVESGIATPIAGKGKDNGTVVGVFGVGAAVRFGKHFDLLYAAETWTSPFTGLQHRFGIGWKF